VSITDLAVLLANLDPRLVPGEFAFCTVQDARYGDLADLEPVGMFAEREAMTLIVPEANARQFGVEHSGPYRMITLNVHSSLEAVGLTAAVARALADEGISANMVAAFHHDHVFVPSNCAKEALQVLSTLQKRHT